MHGRHPQRLALCAPQAGRKLCDREIGPHALGQVQGEKQMPMTAPLAHGDQREFGSS